MIKLKEMITEDYEDQFLKDLERLGFYNENESIISEDFSADIKSTIKKYSGKIAPYILLGIMLATPMGQLHATEIGDIINGEIEVITQANDNVEIDGDNIIIKTKGSGASSDFSIKKAKDAAINSLGKILKGIITKNDDASVLSIAKKIFNDAGIKTGKVTSLKQNGNVYECEMTSTYDISDILEK